MVVFFGGAFNPPTIAHKQIIKELNSQFVIEKIYIVPTFTSDVKKLIDFKHRFKMLKKLFKKERNVIISDYEKKNGFKGTYYALLDLEKKCGEKPHLVIGADNLLDIKNWINAKILLDNYNLIVFNRDRLLNWSKVSKFMEETNAKISYLDLKVEASSSKFRENPNENQNMVDPIVYKYLIKKKLLE